MALIELNLDPNRRELRWFALIWLVFFSLIGLLLWKLVALPAGVAAWVLALAVSGWGLLRPGFMRVVYVGWMRAVYPLGWLISHAILAGVYFLILSPIGLLMRALGRDPLDRRVKPEAQTYWIRRTGARDLKTYFKQF